MAGFEIEDEENCILGICCEPQRQMKALAVKIDREVPGINEGQSKHMAQWMLATYDLAPHGTLHELFEQVAAMARAYPYQG